MPIVIVHDQPGAMAGVAQNVGGFATQNALQQQALRERQFQDEQAGRAAGFALGGIGQAFQQNQQVQNQQFAQQQALAQRAFQQQSLDADSYRAQLAAAAADSSAALRGQQQMDLANLRGNYGLDREGMRQDSMNQRADDSNALKAYMQQNGLDWRTANQDQINQARMELQNLRGQQASDRQVAGFDQQQLMQTNKEDWQGGQNDLNRQFRQQQQDQRNSATDTRSNLALFNSQRIAAGQRLSAVERQASILAQIARETQPDALGLSKQPTPRALQAQQQLPALFEEINKLRQMLPDPSQVPDIRSVYQQQDVPITDLQPDASGFFGGPPQQQMPTQSAQPVTALDGTKWIPTGQTDQNGKMLYQRVQ